MENISIGCYISFDLVLIESLTILPAHLAHSSDKESNSPTFESFPKLGKNSD